METVKTIHRGKVAIWNPQKAYGFIKTESDKNVFFHISGIKDSIVPKFGMVAEFEIGKDRQGRPIAIEITLKDE